MHLCSITDIGWGVAVKVAVAVLGIDVWVFSGVTDGVTRVGVNVAVM
jgi:hypothetical protein